MNTQCIKWDEPTRKLDRSLVLAVMKCVGILWLCLPPRLAANPPSYVNVGMSLSSPDPQFEGPTNGYTGWLVVRAAGAQVRSEIEVPPMAVHTNGPAGGPAPMKMEIDRIYPFSVTSQYRYTAHLHFDLPYCDALGYYLEITDGNGLTTVIDSPSDDYPLSIGDTAVTGTIVLRATYAVFFGNSCSCGAPIEGPQLIADDESTITAFITYDKGGALSDVSWSIVPPDRGCSVEASWSTAEGSAAIIKAGHEGGTITVRATDSSGCFSDGILALTCGLDNNQGSGGGCPGAGCTANGQGNIQNRLLRRFQWNE